MRPHLREQRVHSRGIPRWSLGTWTFGIDCFSTLSHYSGTFYPIR